MSTKVNQSSDVIRLQQKNLLITCSRATKLIRVHMLRALARLLIKNLEFNNVSLQLQGVQVPWISVQY